MPTIATQPRLRRPVLAALLVLAAALFTGLPAQAYNQNRVATDAAGNPIRIQGTVVMIEPDIELSEVLAGGVQEPRQAWTEAARRLYPQAVHRRLAAANTEMKPDYLVPRDLSPDTRLGQVLRLNEAVSLSILAYTSPCNQLATKKGKRLDWTLGPGAQELRAVTGADYALFTYIRDSYTSGGQAALRIAALVLLGADIGGGMQVGVTTLVDLRTGQVVWFNFLAKQTGDLRDEQGAATTAERMLKGLPL
jgi:hypothetical protein